MKRSKLTKTYYYSDHCLLGKSESAERAKLRKEHRLYSSRRNAIEFGAFTSR